MAKKFTLTAPQRSSEHLALKKLDEIISKLDSIGAKLDADSGVGDTDYQSSITSQLSSIADELFESNLFKTAYKE